MAPTIKRATVQITFVYERAERSRPDKWDWTDLIEETVENVVLLSDEEVSDGEVCLWE